MCVCVCVCVRVCVCVCVFACEPRHIHADIFPDNQLYILMATENAGIPLEDHKVHYIILVIFHILVLTEGSLGLYCSLHLSKKLSVLSAKWLGPWQ